jgi:hypothetical protein
MQSVLKQICLSKNEIFYIVLTLDIIQQRKNLICNNPRKFKMTLTTQMYLFIITPDSTYVSLTFFLIY